MTRSTIILLAGLALLVGGIPAAAQDLGGTVTQDPSAGTAIYDFHFDGPPTSCGYPIGGLFTVFPTFVPFPCLLPSIYTGLIDLTGDVGMNRQQDVFWACDDFRLGSYSANGIPISAHLSPIFPVRGLGVNSCTGSLWITDGNQVTEVLPGPPPCGPLATITPPWPKPLGFGLLTDVDFDPNTGSVWFIDEFGNLGNTDPLGGLIAGPIPVNACGMAGPFTGMAIDTATPGVLGLPPAAFVTDGFTVGYVELHTGLPATPTFYMPNPCGTPVPGAPPIHGLSFSTHGLNYGTSPDPELIFTVGNAVSAAMCPAQPPSFDLVLDNLPLGADLYLAFGTKARCPAASLGGKPFLVQQLGILPLGPIGAPTLVQPLILPPGLNGISIMLQGIVDMSPGVPGGPYEVTPGLVFTPS